MPPTHDGGAARARGYGSTGIGAGRAVAVGDGENLEIRQTYWGCKFIFTLNLKNGKGPKLRRNIKIHGELIIINCNFPEFPKVFIFIFLGGLVEMSMTPRNHDS